MSGRWLGLILGVVAVGSFALLADSTITEVVPGLLDLRPERAFQSRVVYGFGAFFGALAWIVLTFLEYDEYVEAYTPNR